MMATPDKSNDDCYFYFYSSCVKGEECPFRHCETALGTETVCSMWREGRCFRKMCKFRHMENRKNRSMIPCYWENQPGGCRKPHCVFFHHRPRTSITEALTEKQDGLILPVSSYPQSPGVSPSAPDITSESNIFIPQENTEDLDVSQVSQIVQPLVVNFDEEGEESDTESTASTPVKVPSLTGNHVDTTEKCHSKLLATVEEYENQQDIGIKTLEQIRMEKVHKESEHIYQTEYLADEGVKDESETCAVEERTTPSSLDLRDHLKHKRTIQSVENTPKPEIPSQNDHTSKKRRIISLKKENTERESSLDTWLRRDVGRFTLEEKETVEVVSQQDLQPMEPNDQKNLDFGIKTLAEIRQEKESKQATPNNTQSPDELPKMETKDVPVIKRKKIILKKPSFGTSNSGKNNQNGMDLNITFTVNNVPNDKCHGEIESDKPTTELSDEVKDAEVDKSPLKVAPKRKLKRKSLELYTPPKANKSSSICDEDKSYLQNEDIESLSAKKLHDKNRISGSLTDLHSNQENSSNNIKKKAIVLRRKKFERPAYAASDEHELSSAVQSSLRESSNLPRSKQNPAVNDEIHWMISSDCSGKSQLNVSIEQEEKLFAKDFHKTEKRDKLPHPIIQRQPLSLKNLGSQDKSTGDGDKANENGNRQVCSPEVLSNCAQKISESAAHAKQNSDLERTCGSVLEDGFVNNKPAPTYKDKLSPTLISLDQGKRESRSSTLSSAEDELDSLLLGSKGDIGLFVDDGSLEDKGEDELLLELEKIINS